MRGRNLIILDENLDPDLKGQLQNRGYEADSVRDLQLLTVKDGALLAWLGERYRNRPWALATADRRMPWKHAPEVANPVALWLSWKMWAEMAKRRMTVCIGGRTGYLLSPPKRCEGISKTPLAMVRPLYALSDKGLFGF